MMRSTSLLLSYSFPSASSSPGICAIAKHREKGDNDDDGYEE